MIKFNIKNQILGFVLVMVSVAQVFASSHREAPLISSDPLADNVDVYAFRSPDDPTTMTLIATYVPLQLPHGGPNYYSFGEDIRYEIHVDNDASVAGDEITYRFTFNIVNEDPTTFFNIRLGQQNQKATYNLERSIDGGQTFEMIVEGGIVPPPNVGPRSIESDVGLGTTYSDLFNGAVTTTSTGETVFAGPTDDPFFVDLGGIFDLGDAPRQDGTPVDGVACYNVSAIAIQVPIATLLKAGAPATPTNILDPDYVIGVWASASRPAITTLSNTGDPVASGDWIQVSRLGMPLTNEAVIAIGDKDYWNAISPYDEISETTLDGYFYNPELALYMDDDQFGGAVPAFAPLRIQTASLGAFDFTNGADGLFPLKGTPAVEGTALDDAIFGGLLLPGPGLPRSVDLWPIFHTGAPNLAPYQLATGKDGDPLADGKPFINNFLPNGGDMLRVNMAVPPTPRDDANFSSLGLIQAAAIGLTVAPFNTTADLEFIPNMDGFPNGRRLEDDVTRIELQAVAGVVLAAVGLWYDDYDPMSDDSPVTEDLLNVLSYTTGVENNDRPFGSSFPYLAQPFSGTGDCSGEIQVNNPPIDDPIFKLFVSSNTQQSIGIYSYDDMGNVGFESFANEAPDADGIHYDEENDILYQLNRTDNVVNAYTDVIESLSNGGTPTLTTISSSDFINGREIAVRNGSLVVAQDANDANGMVNKFAIYDVDGTGNITYNREIESPVNLWGITFVGNSLFAIEDNSNNVAIFDDFLDAPAGMIAVSRSVSVEGIVRTHGLTYESNGDVLILTDVGSGADPEDGAFTVIENFSDVSADDNVAADEQVRVEGASTELGNPVDVAYDIDGGIIYIAERANEGGKILAFEYPTTGGDIAPDVSTPYGGASAVYLSDCVNGNENGGNGMEQDPVGVVYFSLDECRSNTTDGSGNDYSEFEAEYPNELDCGTFLVDGTLNRANPSANGHSCTPGVDNTIAMCVGSMQSCTYNPTSDQAIQFTVNVNPDDNADGIRLSSLTFFEKGPESYDWVSGPSGPNNYPTLYGVRILADGVEIFSQSDIATTTNWSLETFVFAGMEDFVITEATEITVMLLGYCPVGNGAAVSAWDIDEVSLNATCVVPMSRSVAGTILTHSGDAMENIEVSIDALLPEFPRTAMTDADGEYAFDNLPSNFNYALTADVDDNHKNGVSTLDLLLIQRHLLGLESLVDPNMMIAADIDGDRRLKVFDLLVLRKLIIGVINEVPTNTSWKFINADQALNMENAYIYEEVLNVSHLDSDKHDEDYIAIKVGDISGNATPSLTGLGISETRSSNALEFSIDELEMKAGEQVRIDITAANFDAVSGFQFTLDHTGLEFVNMESNVLEFSEANFSLLKDDRMAVSWSSGSAVTAAKNDVLFTLIMNVKESSNIAQMIDINDEFIRAESYVGSNLDIQGVNLSINRNSETEIGNVLYNNTPNPFSTQTTIGFFLEKGSKATINIYDVQGRVVKTITNTYEAGKHFINIDKSELDLTEGILYYQLETDNFTATKKMIMM